MTVLFSFCRPGFVSQECGTGRDCLSQDLWQSQHCFHGPGLLRQIEPRTLHSRSHPTEPLMDDRLGITVSGLAPDQLITIWAKSRAQDEIWWRSIVAAPGDLR